MTAPHRISTPLSFEVHLTEERWVHTCGEHPEMKAYRAQVTETLQEPDEVRESRYDPEVLLFYRFYLDIHEGKYVTVVVKHDPVRSFMLTAYITDKVKRGGLRWQRH